jgi:Fic family protein
MSSFAPNFLRRFHPETAELKALQLLAASRARLQGLSHAQPAVLESLRVSALVGSVESSNRLEGIVTTAERLGPLVQKKLRPKGRDEAQIAGYRDALALIHDPRTRPSSDEAGLLRLHRLLSGDEADAGRYKARDNSIVERTAGGALRVRFKPVSAKATPGAMRQWFLQHQWAVQEGLDPILSAGLLVLDLTCIHPFRDGNGRLSRLWTLLLLYERGFDLGRYISLEQLTEASKERYYANLGASSRDWHQGRHDPHPWLSYFLMLLCQGHLQLEAKLQGTRGKRGDKSLLVANTALAFKAPFRLAELAGQCPGVGIEQVRVVVRRLCRQGKLRLLTRGRDAQYSVATVKRPETKP